MKTVCINHLNRILLVSLLNAAIFLSGCGGGSSTQAPPAAPPQPKVLISASPRSATSAYTSFAVVNTTATKFNVYRSTTSGSVGQKVGIDLPATSTEFIDRGLASNTSYWYTIEAVTTTSSTYSSQIPVTTQANVVYPAPPGNLIATSVPPASKIALPSWNIEWDAYPGATDYVVYSTTVAELVGNAQLSTQVAVVTTPLLTGQTLTTGGIYYYWVIARGNGWAKPSDAALIRIVDNSRTALLLPTVDAPIIDTTSSSQQSDHFTLYFYGGRGAGSHHIYAEAEEYSIQMLPPVIKTFPALDIASNSIQIVQIRTGYYQVNIPYSFLSALSFGNFSLYVEAVGGGAKPVTARSQMLAIQVPASSPPPPASLTRFTAKAMSPYRIDLSWDPIPGVSVYEIYRSSNSEALELLSTTMGTTYSDTGLPARSGYSYILGALNPSSGVKVLLNTSAVTLRSIAPELNAEIRTDSNWHGQLTWKADNDGPTYAVYSEYTRALILFGSGSKKSLELTTSALDAQVTVPVTFINNLIYDINPFPLWGCFWVAEIYPDQTQSPLSYGQCAIFNGP